MFSLGIDTSQSLGSLCLFQDRNILEFHSWSRSGSHSEYLTAALENLLKKHQLDLKKINRIGVGIGPGSFTGVRVGVNFARTVGYVFNTPILPMCSLELTAWQLSGNAKYREIPIHVLQYGFRDIFYSASYKFNNLGHLETLLQPAAVQVHDLKKFLQRSGLVVGNLQEIMGTDFKVNLPTDCLFDDGVSPGPRSDFFEHTQLTHEDSSQFSTWSQTLPLYIRASEAEEKLRGGLLKPMV